MSYTDVLDDGLFDMEREPTNLLKDRFGLPPLSVISRRDGDVQDRDRKWKSLGIQSEVGRGDALTYNMRYDYMHDSTHLESAANAAQTSIFSPTITEWVYRNFTRPGARILDPFAGGSVRGVVASALARWYTGIELRPEQVEANRAQSHLGGDVTPEWIEGDAADVRDLVEPAFEADLIFSCPPYAYLEEYSDIPGDLSIMDYPDFLDAYRRIIADTAALLRPDRFAVWVVGEVRNKRDGTLLGLVPDTVQAFEDAGLKFYNDHVIATPIGTAAVRTPKQWQVSRKMGRVHEYMLTFVKGDPKAATKWLEAPDVPLSDLDDDVADTLRAAEMSA